MTMKYDFDGQVFTDRSGSHIGYLNRGKVIYNARGAEEGRIAHGAIYNQAGSRIASVLGNIVADEHNKQLISIPDVKKVISLDEMNVCLAALWYFFIKDKDRR